MESNEDTTIIKLGRFSISALTDWLLPPVAPSRQDSAVLLALRPSFAFLLTMRRPGNPADTDGIEIGAVIILRVLRIEWKDFELQ